MSLYKRILRIVKPAGFLQDHVRDTDLAYVMEHADPVHSVLIALAVSQFLGDKPRICGNPHGMSLCIRVLGIYYPGKGPETLQQYHLGFLLSLLYLSVLGIIELIVQEQSCRKDHAP